MNLHPPLSSAPAIFLLSGSCIELLGLFFRNDTLRRGALLLLLLGCAAFPLTYLTGLAAESQLSPAALAQHRAALDAHEGWGRFGALCTILPLLFVAIRESAAARVRRVFTVLSLLSFLGLTFLAVYTSFLGGELVFEHAVGVSSAE